jgi:hypothetical protein
MRKTRADRLIPSHLFLDSGRAMTPARFKRARARDSLAPQIDAFSPGV